MRPTREAEVLAKVLYAEVQRMFIGVGRVANVAKALRDQSWSALSVASFPVLARRVLPGIVTSFCADKPDVKFSVESMRSNRRSPRSIRTIRLRSWPVRRTVFDTQKIAQDIALGGFDADPHIEILAMRSRAASAHAVAVAYCQGTPLCSEIKARSGASIDDATAACTAAITAQFGDGPITANMQAHVVMVRR